MSDMRTMIEFRDDLERGVAFADFEKLERRGRAIRRRRQVTGIAVAVLLLGTTGALVGIDRLADRSVDPIGQPDTGQVDLPAGVSAYPGNLMETLTPGTYQMRTSYKADHPVVRVTLGEGWNAWDGPNRFEGIGDYPNNEDALEHATWYAGLLAMEVRGVSSKLCVSPGVEDRIEPTAAALVEALRNIPGYEVLAGPSSTMRFGYPATHLRMKGSAVTDCESALFETVWSGMVSGTPLGPVDLWVVDVAGTPVLLRAFMSGNIPRAERRLVVDAIDTVEFVLPE